MRVTFLGQPFEDFGGWSSDLLSRWLQTPATTRIRIAIAWAKRSGLIRIQPVIERFRAGGGTIQIILGIDEGGATEQGLRLAMEMFDSAYVFHDPSLRTFHPKVYVSEAGETAEVFVGSSNLTAGGLFSNYEAGVLVSLDLTQPNDQAFLNQIDDWFQTLYGDPEVCKSLDDQLLESIVSDPSFRISNEDEPTSRGTPERDDYDGVVEGSEQMRPFGASTTAKRGRAPAVGRSPKSARRQPTPIAVPAPGAPASTPAVTQVTHRWLKRLSASDAQHPPSQNTKITGNLKLTDAGNDIDRNTYFVMTCSVT